MGPVSPFHMNAVSAVLALYIQKYTLYSLYDLHHPNISPGFLLATLQVCIKSFLFRGLSSTLLNRMSCVSAGKSPPYITLAVHPTPFVQQALLSVRQATRGWKPAPVQPSTCQSATASQRLCTNKLIELTLKSIAGPELGNYKSRVISRT